MRYIELHEAKNTFYHGTSSKVLPLIQQHGLTPQTDPESAMRGNWSTIPGYTERMVFLTPLAKEAMYYAEEVCQKIGGEPVLLAVDLLPSDPLHVSDDYIIGVIIRAMMTHEGHPPLTSDDFDEDGDLAFDVSDAAGAFHEWQEYLADHSEAFYRGDLKSVADHSADYWDNSDDLLATLEIGYAAFQRAAKAPWQISARRGQRDPAVVFAGTIPPTRIKILDQNEMRTAGAFRSRKRSTRFIEA